MNNIKNRISIHELGNAHQPWCDPTQVINANKRVVIRILIKKRSTVSLYLRIGKVDTLVRQISETQT